MLEVEFTTAMTSQTSFTDRVASDVAVSVVPLAFVADRVTVPLPVLVTLNQT